MNIISYITEEVTRQGHDTKKVDGLERVAFMLNAWVYALNLFGPIDYKTPSIADVKIFGMMIEPSHNAHGFRTCNIFIGNDFFAKPIGARPELIEHKLEGLWGRIGELTPIEFYKAFEEIHPFRDGNGRTGKIILNWLNNTLDNPIFPPSNLWGREIANP